MEIGRAAVRAWTTELDPGCNCRACGLREMPFVDTWMPGVDPANEIPWIGPLGNI